MRQLLRDLDLLAKITRQVGADLTTQEEFELATRFKHVFLRKGDKLCHAGQKDDKLYVLLRGKLQLSIPSKKSSEKEPLRPVKTLSKPSELVTFITASKPETAACTLIDLVMEDHALEQKILAHESIKTLDIFKELHEQQEKRSSQSQHPLRKIGNDAVDQVI